MKVFKRDKRRYKYSELTPYRILEHEIIENNGFVKVLIPKYRGKILGRFIQPRLKYKYFTAEFDRFGTAVWLKLDGKTKIGKLAEMLNEEFGEEIQPIIPRLTTFCKQLYNANFISFIELERK